CVCVWDRGRKMEIREKKRETFPFHLLFTQCAHLSCSHTCPVTSLLTLRLRPPWGSHVSLSHTHPHTHTHTHAHTHPHTRAHTHTHTHTQIRTHTQAHTHTHSITP